MTNKILGCLIILTLWVPSLTFACTGITAEQLQKKMQMEPVDQLVFFASWCLSCKEHLRPDALAKSYFVGIFDEQNAVHQAFKAILGEPNLSRCIWDQDGSIAAFYKVKSLPALRMLKIK